jgi:hypothetical protein
MDAIYNGMNTNETAFQIEMNKATASVGVYERRSGLDLESRSTLQNMDKLILAFGWPIALFIRRSKSVRDSRATKRR